MLHVYFSYHIRQRCATCFLIFGDLWCLRYSGRPSILEYETVDDELAAAALIFFYVIHTVSGRRRCYVL